MSGLKKLLLILAVCYGTCMAAPCVAATTRGEVLLEGANITLGDLFLNVGDKAGMIVAPAPNPGQKIAYDVTALTHIARSNGFEWKPETTYERVVITRAAQTLNSAMIKELVIAELGKSHADKDLDITLDNQSIEVFRAKSEPLTYHLTELKYDPIKNRFDTSLVIEKANSPNSEILKITGKAMPMVQVAILKHNLASGSAVSEGDIDWTRVPADKAGADAITEASRLSNNESRRNITVGSILRIRDLRGARLVSKGSLITIAVESPIMKITTQGRAMADGAMGDTIQVINTQSNRAVDAVVVGSGQVSVTPVTTSAKLAAK